VSSQIELIFAKYAVLHHCYPKAGFNRQAAIKMLSDVYPNALNKDIEYAIRWAYSWIKRISKPGGCVLCTDEDIDKIICSDCDVKYQIFIKVMK
jgi:hypothetical protein